MIGKQFRILIKDQEGKDEMKIENSGVLDEVVLEDWFHLELMDKNSYWLRVGDARISILLDTGKPKISIERDIY